VGCAQFAAHTCRRLAPPCPTYPSPRRSLDAEIVARTRDAVGDADVPDDLVVERALNVYLLGRLLDTVGGDTYSPRRATEG
jgi:hypothetical protein